MKSEKQKIEDKSHVTTWVTHIGVVGESMEYARVTQKIMNEGKRRVERYKILSCLVGESRKQKKVGR